MYRTHQRLGCESGSDPNEECFDGCGCSRYSSQVWHASFQVNHPINYVHTDLESFVLYSDSFNDIDSQLVEVDDIPEITENFKEILKKEGQDQQNTVGQSAKSNGQQACKA